MTESFDIKRYTEQRDNLRKRYLADKTGDQTLLSERTKIFQPLLQSQKQLQEKLIENQNATSKALVPFVNELQRHNNLIETSQLLPFHNVAEIEEVPQSTPEKSTQSDIYIDFDQKLNATDLENLQDMSFKLPSEVQKKGTYDEVLKQVNSESHRIGAHLGKVAKPKPSEKERQMLESRKATLTKYKELLINARVSTEKFLVPKKTGKGFPLCKPIRKRGRPKIRPDPILYNNADNLARKLYEHYAAHEAGNTGLDDIIISMLDELLKIRAIDKDMYDKIYKKIILK